VVRCSRRGHFADEGKGRAPAALVVLGELDVVAVAVHPDDYIADAAPGVEPAVKGDDAGASWCGAQGGEADNCMEKAAAPVGHAYSIT
jgi:hypothetical protein